MRRVVHDHMEESKTYYDEVSLKISEGLSVIQQEAKKSEKGKNK